MSEYEGKYPKDFLGATINVGSEIVYPSRRGSAMWLSKGRVKDLACGPPGTAFKLEVVTESASGKKRIAHGIPSERCVVVR